MNFKEYKGYFIEEASAAGYSKNNIDLCLEYAEPIIERGLPVIYNTSHLSGLVGYHKDYLKKAVLNTNYYYRHFKIKKQNGSLRNISEPLPSLKEIQSWILNEILYNIKVSVFSKAYRPNVGLVENLRYHVKQPKVLTIDIKDFFPTISQKKVEDLFKSFGYSDLISNLLSKLCTLENKLPQGAPTSPYISNLIFKDLDSTISKYCKERKIMFTRYADDLTFSGNFDDKELEVWLTKVLLNDGFRVNPDKTRLMTPNLRQVVTGVIVNEKIQAPIELRKSLRQTIYYIQKFGLSSHMKREHIVKSNYLIHLIGKVNYVLQMNPEDSQFLEYRSFLNNLKDES